LFGEIRDLIRDTFHPRQIESSVAPIEVEEIWSKPKTGLPRLLSAGVHVLIVVLALVPWATQPNITKANETAVLVYMPSDLVLNLPQTDDKSGGGGGGGKKQLTPPSLGKLPRPSDKQFVPPDPEPPKNPDPTLIVDPTVVAPQLAQLPQLNLLNIGDPAGVVGPPSSGPGVGGGIGTGSGRGVGEGKGPGVGPGEGGGFGGGVFRVGGGVTPPSVIQRIEPQYSEEARKARYQGTVVLEAIVRKDGTCDILRIVRSLGFGLDENAIQALKQWRFRPGMRNGVPVDVALNIEVNFNLR
jgi:TonB family protein